MSESMTELVERLLYEEEGTALDFKREQYHFVGASDAEKSELLKDVLAFANSWRRTDAYILVGVEEVKGSRSLVTGMSSDLDDACLQQFVSSKTQRPLDFFYKAVNFEGKMVGVFCIPRQSRPFYLTKDYGMLKRDTVYVRRGSSTAIASPEEVARMGADSILGLNREVSLSAQFATAEDKVLAGHEIEISTIDFTFPDDTQIPDYGTSHRSGSVLFGHVTPGFGENKDFYRECARYLKTTYSVSGLRLSVTNSGTGTASDVKIVLRVADEKHQVILLDSDHMPIVPHRNSLHISRSIKPFSYRNGPDVVVENIQRAWQVVARIPKVQAKDSVLTDSRLYVGANADCQIVFDATIYCDELRSPATAVLTVTVRVEQRSLTTNELITKLGV